MREVKVVGHPQWVPCVKMAIQWPDGERHRYSLIGTVWFNNDHASRLSRVTDRHEEMLLNMLYEQSGEGCA